MSKYKLNFQLKQHTPIIHFQWEQEGATLRASEVKPKLDFFIMRKLLKDTEIPNHKVRDEFYRKAMTLQADGTCHPWKNWLVGKGKNEHVALDYKLAIQPVEEDWVEKFIIASFIPKSRVFDYEREGKKVLDRTPYFADNKPLKVGEVNEAKLGLMLKNGKELKLIFRFLDLNLEQLLKEALPLFFTSTNFGSRQSKGFGCFLPANITQRELENSLNTYFPIVFKSLRSQHFKDLKDVFLEIDSVYKNLKSGDRNHESELRNYFNDFRPVIEWEKPAIQEKVAEISGINLRIKSKTSNRQFVRALLGLPEIFEYPKHGGIKAQVKFDKRTATKKNEIIERYGSPILFKIFDHIIYLVATENEYSETMLNKSFNFEFAHQGRKYGNMLSLKTPKEFDIVEFLEIAMGNQPNWNKIS